jgi:hypothetical protein
VFSEYDYGIVVLLHATLWALDAGLEPRHDALVVEHVLTLELLVIALGQFKTDGTCLRKMCKAFSLLDRLLFALGP